MKTDKKKIYVITEIELQSELMIYADRFTNILILAFESPLGNNWFRFRFVRAVLRRPYYFPSYNLNRRFTANVASNYKWDETSHGQQTWISIMTVGINCCSPVLLVADWSAHLIPGRFFNKHFLPMKQAIVYTNSHHRSCLTVSNCLKFIYKAISVWEP